MQTRPSESKDFPSAKEPHVRGGNFARDCAFHPGQNHNLSDLVQKRRFWKRHLEQCRQSPLTQKSYCEKHGLKIHQFYYWKRRLASDHAKVAFLPVDFCTDSPSAISCAVRIITPGGLVIELQGPVNLSEVLSMAARL